uniref:Uncharacterized protein n=1 Tax=Schistosoma japonicum TaxID=6182 RepID=Q5BY97_SCHJA|nr:unknown [Schistosoma japonicum]
MNAKNVIVKNVHQLHNVMSVQYVINVDVAIFVH